MNSDGQGASSSLNKTITDVLEFLKDPGLDRPSPFNGNLRGYLMEKIWDVAQEAYKKGYQQAHRDCASDFKALGRVGSHAIMYKGYEMLAPGKARKVPVNSVIKL